MEQSGRRQRGSLKMRFMYVVREDIEIVGMREKNAEDREKC